MPVTEVSHAYMQDSYPGGSLTALLILEGPRMPVTEVSHAYTIYTTHMMQERKPIFSKRILMNTLMKQEEARKAAAKKLIESS